MIANLIEYREHNSWELSPLGRECINGFYELAPDGTLAVYKCFLWSEQLKKIFNKKYEPSDHDFGRPASMQRVRIPGSVNFQVADDLLAIDDVDAVVSRLNTLLGITVVKNRVSIAFALSALDDLERSQQLELFENNR